MKRLFSKLFHRPQSHGEYVITVLDGAKLESLPRWQDYFDLRRYSFDDRWRALSAIPGLVKQQTVKQNLHPTVGLRLLTKALANDLSTISQVAVNYAALGSSTSAVAAGNTQLGTEVYRKAISSLGWDATNAKFYATAFFGLTETTGTYEEVGLFINGTGTANSGTLWSRALQNIVKTSSDSLTIDYIDTFTSS